MHSDTFGYVRKRSEAFGHFQNLCICSTVFSLVLDTGEANDQMCGPTAQKISERCSLKPSSFLLFVVAAALTDKTKTGFASKKSDNLRFWIAQKPDRYHNKKTRHGNPFCFQLDNASLLRTSLHIHVQDVIASLARKIQRTVLTHFSIKLD